MALLFMEGFDTENAASTLLQKGWATWDTGQSLQTGRFGGKAGRLNGTAGEAALPSTHATVICGFALRGATIATTNDFFRLTDASFNTICALNMQGSKIRVRNSGGTVIATGGTTLSSNVWYYIEVKLFVNAGTPASGTVEVHIGGAVEIASTVGNFGSTLVGGIWLNNGPGTTDIDDLYVVDTSGSNNNTFLGDVRIKTIFPNGAGAHTQWTGNGGASNYQDVNDQSGTYPDGDTTYIGSGNPGDIDTYAFDDVDGGATVYGVQVSLYARKDDAGTRQIAPVIRQSSTDHVGNTFTLASTYAYYKELYDQDPTAANWTPSVVNGDEFGVKEIA